MAKGRPWYKRDPERWIMGTRGLTLEERGAYSEVVDLLNLRDHALPDDIKTMAALLGCPPQRWRKIRQVLISRGKLTTNGEYLTNPRFEREKAERDLSRAEAVVHGREGGLRSAELRAAQSEFDLDESQEQSAKPANKLKESSKKVATKLPLHGEQQTPLSTKSAKKDQGNPQAPYARARESEDKSIESSQPDSSYDMAQMFETVCDVAGFHPTSQDAIDRAQRTIMAWIEKGIDFDSVIIPTIRSIIANSTEGPTRVLSRFTPHIANEHAKRSALTAQGKRYAPPAAPILEREDETEEMTEIRRILCQALGPAIYASWFNALLMVRDDEGDLLVIGRSAGPLRQTQAFTTLEAVARRFKFRWIKDYDRPPSWLREGEREAARSP